MVEDWLLRHAVQREFHAGDEVDEFPRWYDRLAEASVGATALAAVLRRDVDAVESAALAEARAANPGAESFGWMHALTPVEDLHEFAGAIETLIELGEVSRAEAEQFFSMRAEQLRTRESRVVGDSGAARRHLESAWSSLPWMSQRDVPPALARVGVLGEDELEQWERRMRPGPWETEDAEVGDVGEVLDRSAGPGERRSGVRVLALERCERGSIVHLHLARSRRDEHGSWRELPDEVVGAEAASWPGFPGLRLEDDVGTAYRGKVAEDDVADAGDSSVDAEQEAHFAPAVPRSARALWLVSDDPRIRFKLI